MLTAAGMKVEKIHRLGEGLEGVVTGTVLEIEPHPNADKLTLVTVDTGSETLRVVCGARNFSPGDKVPVARPGSRLPALGTLESRKIRGVASEGMLCSAMELGYGQDHSGILVLPASAQVGRDVRDILGLDETVLDLEITPNRPDAMSLMGIAREVAACTGAALKEQSYPANEGVRQVAELVEVQLKDPGGCPRYLARVIEGVEIGPSPGFVQRRLSLAGIRPISNVVDATNYGLLITGHPMHAFDLDRLTDSTIVVRRGEAGETLVGIDGEERKLDPDDLIIADSVRPVALAGLMGGLETGVTENTTRVALESALFDPASIFRASQRHGLRTESSARFERGADPNNVEFAAGVAASLILDWAGGDLARGKVDHYPDPEQPATVTMRQSRARAVLGMDLEAGQMIGALGRLGLECREEHDVVRVTVPTRRRDLKAEEDLIEEIARVIGYDRIPSTLPAGRNRAALPTPRQKFVRRIHAALTGAGLFEARTSILVGAKDLEKLSFTGPALRLSNPLTKDEAVLRPSLLPGLIASMARNLARRNLDVRLYEVGSVFLKEPERSEPLRLGIVLGGEQAQTWHSRSRRLDFYDLKGVVETLLFGLGVQDYGLRDGAAPPFHPERSAEITAGGRTLGSFGEMGEDELGALDLGFAVGLGEFDLEAMLEVSSPLVPGEAEGSRFPAVFLDLAVSVPETVRAHDVERTARDAAGGNLESIRLIDVYRGEQAGQGRKSLAFSLSFRSPDRTLTEGEALGARDLIAAAVSGRHGGKVRA